MRRRKYMQSVGGAVAFGALGIREAQARPSDSEIRRRLREAFIQDGASGAKDEAEELGLVHDQGVGKPESPGEVSDQEGYSESDSELSVLTLEGSEPDQVAVFSQMQFGSLTGGLRTSVYCDDVLGFGYNEQHWSLVGSPTTRATEQNKASFYTDSVNQGGVVAAINILRDQDGIPADAYAEVYGQLQNLDGVPGTIWGHHEHTVAYTPGGLIDQVEAGPQQFKVTLSNATTKWEMATPSDPESALNA